MNLPFFKFLEKLYWIIDALLTILNNKQHNPKKISPQKYIAIDHLVWLCGQIRGIVILLNEAFALQAQQLIRSIWEAKINLIYISLQPAERSWGFYRNFAYELELLKLEAQKKNPWLPKEFKDLPLPANPNSNTKAEWKKKLFQRIKAIKDSRKRIGKRLEQEYMSIYKKYSWPVHVTSNLLASYRQLGPNKTNYDPNQSPEKIPGTLLLASNVVFEVLTEINKVLKLKTRDELITIKKELVSLINLKRYGRNQQ